MKILIVCQYYYPKNFSITRIAEGLAARGFSVDVLTGKPDIGYGVIDPKYKDVNDEIINRVNVHRVDISPCKKNTLSLIKNYVSFWRNSRKWVKNCKENYDVVYSYSLSPVTILSPANLYKKLHNVPHITHVLDIWPESVVATHHTIKYFPMYWFYYFLSKKLYKGADKILIGSPSYKEYFERVLKIRNKPIIYVPQPSLLEIDTIKPYSFKGMNNILYCGNINRLQLCDMFVPVFKELKNEPVTLHVVGSGRYQKDLMDEIKANGLEEKIIMHGPKPSIEAAGYILSSDVVLVSLSNKTVVGKTIPAKLIIAMAFAKPVIAVLDGDGKKVLKEADGAFFSEQNISSLVSTIKSFIDTSDENRKKLGINNFSYYSKNFALDNILEKIIISLRK